MNLLLVQAYNGHSRDATLVNANVNICYEHGKKGEDWRVQGGQVFVKKPDSVKEILVNMVTKVQSDKRQRQNYSVKKWVGEVDVSSEDSEKSAPEACKESAAKNDANQKTTTQKNAGPESIVNPHLREVYDRQLPYWKEQYKIIDVIEQEKLWRDLGGDQGYEDL